MTSPWTPGKLGQLIREHRRTHSYGLREFADLAQVSPGTISRLESGEQASVQRTTRNKLARALGYDAQEFQQILADKEPTKQGPQMSLADWCRWNGLLTDDQVKIMVSIYEEFTQQVRERGELHREVAEIRQKLRQGKTEK